MSVIDQTLNRAAEAVASGTHLGIQLYASISGEQVVDVAFGQLAPGTDLTTDDAIPWVCGAKPIGAIALGQLLDGGHLTPDTRVADVVPEYGASGKENVTVAHLMSHSVPYASHGNRPLSGLTDSEELQVVCATPLEAAAGTRAVYSPMASWIVLAEIVRRITGRSYEDYVDDNVLRPLKMDRTIYGQRRARDLRDVRRGELHELVDGVQAPAVSILPTATAVHLAGTGAHGPAREFARPIECLTGGGSWGGTPLLSRETTATIVRPHRTGLPDGTFGDLNLSWGLGVCTDYVWFGAPRGARVAGHTGYDCSLVVGDLDRELVVAFLSTSVVSSGQGRSRLENRLVKDLYRLMDDKR